MLLLEKRSQQWCEYNFGLSQLFQQPANSSMKAFRSLVIPFERLLEDKPSEKKIIQFEYALRIKNLIKTMFDDIIFFLLFLLCFYQNNVLAVLTIPFMMISLCKGTSLKFTLAINIYVSIMFLLQYSLLCSNQFEDNAPQKQNFRKLSELFNVHPWPWYKNFFKEDDQNDSQLAYYFSIGSNSLTRKNLWIYILIFAIMSLYFTLFCSSFTTMEKITKKLKLQMEMANRGKNDFMTKVKPEMDCWQRKLYKVLESILFKYLHVGILILLLVSSTTSDGILALVYMGFTIFLLQKNLFDIFSMRPGQLQNYFLWVLKPFAFLDLASQVLYQIPGAANLVNENYAKIIGVFLIGGSKFF